MSKCQTFQFQCQLNVSKGKCDVMDESVRSVLSAVYSFVSVVERLSCDCHVDGRHAIMQYSGETMTFGPSLFNCLLKILMFCSIN